ncbi:MAG: carboxymuconolactone decarboxylase family protein [Alphaproteobacteria bacterium]|nr:carboxymuconolactone decarboxylase family protein [Alphaproteobacteria bacterium]
MTRIPYADPAPDSPAGRFLAKLPLNVARMMAHSPEQMLAFQRFGEAVLSKGALDPRLRELAILRVGWRLGAAYETHHHERIGRAVGMSEAQLAAARTGDATGLPEKDRLVLACADALESTGGLPDALFADLTRVFPHQELVELVLATGFYGMVSRFLNAFGVEVEEGDQVRLRVVEG